MSAITDTYEDLGIIDDDGTSIGLSVCTPDSELNFIPQEGFSSGATSPSITITVEAEPSDLQSQEVSFISIVIWSKIHEI